MRKLILAAATLALAAGSSAEAKPGVAVERIVLLMRHGVRPPTKAQPMPVGIAVDAWPAWPVKPGYLTPHGAQAVTLLGGFDRSVLAARLFGHACPPAGSVSVHADSDQRTIATADAWLAGFAPGCGIISDHHAQDDPDPLFSPIDTGAVPFDPARANDAVAADLAPGGLAAVESAQRGVLAMLDRILCGPKPVAGCGVSGKPSRLVPADAGQKPKFKGALDLGSTAGQILLLEYAEGKPMAEIGWGRASRADIAAASTLHAVEYRVLARPAYVAASNSALIARRMVAALTDPHAARLTLLVGHDTNVAALAGLLDLHWHAPGFAADDPSPGGAIGFELVGDGAGKRFVRAIFRSQSLDGIRALAPVPASAVTMLPIPGCRAVPGRGCPLARFTALVEQRLAR
ncbi:histidine-type phosphatase [Sphingomonas oligophenolica]|uniref:Histidine-type phosphatase n=1 Tax=Sphingomonas oligophenolica TaxID=301154 RepID=A0ABU9Y100_9SPHN